MSKKFSFIHVVVSIMIFFSEIKKFDVKFTFTIKTKTFHFSTYYNSTNQVVKSSKNWLLRSVLISQSFRNYYIGTVFRMIMKFHNFLKLVNFG